MTTLTLETLTDFDVIECYSCHVQFAITTAMNAQRLQDKTSFWCPNGHGQAYTGKTDKQLLREAKEREAAEAQRAAEERRRAERAEAALKKARDEANRLKKRSEAGVCPCCNRSFVQMSRHMATKHPDYVEKPRDEAE